MRGDSTGFEPEPPLQHCYSCALKAYSVKHMAAAAAGPGCLFSRHRYPQSQFSPSCPGFSVIISPPRVAKANFRAGRVSTSAPPVHKIFGRRNVAAKLKANLNQLYAYADFSRSKIPWKLTICKVKVDELKPSKESRDKREGKSSPGPSKSKPSDDRRAKSTASGGSEEAPVTEGRGNFGQKSPRQSKRRRFGAWEWQWSPKTQEIAVLIFQLILVFFLMRVLRPRGAQHPDHAHVTISYVNVPFSEFLTRVKSKQVQRVEVDGERFTFHMKPAVLLNTETETNGNTMGMAVTTKKRIIFTTSRPADMKTPYDLMLENHVTFEAPDLPLGNSLISATLAILYVALVAGLLNQLLMKFLQNPTGPSRKHKAGARHKTKSGNQGGLVMFADVAGVDEAKEELEEIVGYLQNPHRYARLGARPPRGVLLVGPPGTGKTFLAKAVAGEANVPFISCSASEFVELYVGMGASHVRDMFARAKKAAPSIIFIDEIDAVAKGRDNRLRTINNDEQEQTLNQLLTEMDGFDSNSIVIVLGATNRADVLDHALLRTGRFDRIVKVEPPDRRGREAILKVHISKKELPLAADVDLNVIATTTTGFSGADLANLVNEAALLAGRANKLVVEMEDFAWAVERSVAGIEKKRSVLKRSEKAAVARHEVGHAVVGTAVANILPGQLQVEKLSILPRSGRALGFTYTPPVGEDRHLLFVDELRGRLVTLFGGRAAEEVVYSGRVSTGALDDIKYATDIAYKTVAEYGLNPAVGPISLSTLSSGGLHESRSAISWTKKQGHMVDLVQREVKSLLQSALATALIVVRSNPTVVEGLGAQLEVNEKVEGEDLREWLKLVVAPKELTAFVKGEFVLPQKTAVIFQSPDKG